MGFNIFWKVNCIFGRKIRKMKRLNENTICGLSERYDAQVIRSKMKEQVVPSKKGGKYKRKKFKLHDND